MAPDQNKDYKSFPSGKHIIRKITKRGTMMITSEQQELLDKAHKAALALKAQADKARALGLTVLEQWLREASVGCQAGVDFQKRVLGPNLSNQTERVVVDKEPNKPQADVIADTIKRRGLVE